MEEALKNMNEGKPAESPPKKCRNSNPRNSNHAVRRFEETRSRSPASDASTDAADVARYSHSERAAIQVNQP